MKIIIIGAGGRLGSVLVRRYRDEHEVTAFNHAQLNIADEGQILARIDTLDFDILINTAAFTSVDLCETHPDDAFRINADAPDVLAEVCSDRNAKLIHFSTDYVFDGAKREPYVESDDAEPISVYGKSKRMGEESVLAAQDRHLVVRVSWVFGPDRPSFIDGVIKRARESEHVDAIADKFSSPTYALDIAEMLPHFFNVDVSGGILHFTNPGPCSWQEYAQHALDCCREEGIPLKAKTVAPLKLADMKDFVARRPAYTVLATAKYTELTGQTPRSWREAVVDYIRRSYSKK
jgi:dTDP-4-dehydrorhamnose reductase